MRILLVGEYRCNMGPANVNKKIIEHMAGDFSYIKFQWPNGIGKVLNVLELLIKLLWAQVVIVSVTSRIGYIAGRMCAFFGKKMVFIMHGCAEYEYKINGCGSKNGRKRQKYLMDHATLILPVSHWYGAWLRDRYPSHKERIGNWCLGFDRVECEKNNPRSKGLIMTAGGNDLRKNNYQLSDAVAGLDGKAKLEIYGTLNPNRPIKENVNTQWMGLVPNDEFIRRLSCADIFVQNSTLESFDISLMEALCCGCSVLVSANIGALDLVEVEPTDVINDVNDVDEIREKIEYLLDHPNNERICEKIDWEEISYKKAIERLRNICEDACGRA